MTSRQAAYLSIVALEKKGRVKTVRRIRGLDIEGVGYGSEVEHQTIN